MDPRVGSKALPCNRCPNLVMSTLGPGMTRRCQWPAGQSSAERGRADSPAGRGVPKRKGGVLPARRGAGSSRTLSAATATLHHPKGPAGSAKCAEQSSPCHSQGHSGLASISVHSLRALLPLGSRLVP